MIFSEDFLEYLRSNPIDGAVKLVEIARDNLVVDSPDWQNEDYPILLEAYALLMEVNESGLLSINLPLFDITGQKDRDCTAINNLLEIVMSHCVSESSRLKIEYMRSHFRTALGAGFAYEFSQGDLTRLQDLISQIRDLISQTHDLEKDHQRRLLNRLEKLQSELHKKVSDLDRFWGLIGDAGVVLGKLGNDAKPIIDRVREIADIIWQTQSRAEELPSGMQVPMLAHKSSIEDETT